MRNLSQRHANLENPSVQRILRAALELWAKAGYHGASLKDIAAAAGVAKSLVHYHFASKEHLLIELQADWCRKVARAVRARLAGGEPSLARALAALDQVFEAMVATRAQFPFALEVWRQSFHQPSIRRRMVAFDREIGALFVEGLASTLGPLAGGLSLPLERAAALIRTVVDGFTLRLFLDDDLDEVRRTYADFKALLPRILLAAPEGGPP